MQNAGLDEAQFSSVAQSFSHSLWSHGLQHARFPCPSPTPGACSNSCLSSWWCYPTISSSVVPSPAFNLSQHQGLFQGVNSLHQAAKVLEFQHQPQHWDEVQALGWSTSWNQNCWEKYQQSQLCRWYHFNGRKWRGTKNLLMKVKEKSERAGLKFNIQKTKNMASGLSLHGK